MCQSVRRCECVLDFCRRGSIVLNRCMGSQASRESLSHADQNNPRTLAHPAHMPY